ncbi:hypothetical protein B0H10DRAFT_1937557 [Mycena sp. CBHHK59/15]|nr:hypothetical protein B0H10DRAFT_1937557 [Mycena sp. CBHHK59/15]
MAVNGKALTGRAAILPPHTRPIYFSPETLDGTGRPAIDSTRPTRKDGDGPLVCVRTLIMLAMLFGEVEKSCTWRASKKVMEEEELLMQALAEKEEDNIPFDGAIEIDSDDKYHA